MIRDNFPEFEFFHSGSRVKKAQDPGSGSATKNLTKTVTMTHDHDCDPDQDHDCDQIYDQRCLSRILIFYFHPRSQIQGSKRHWNSDPDPQHCVCVRYRYLPNQQCTWGLGDRVEVTVDEKSVARAHPGLQLRHNVLNVPSTKCNPFVKPPYAAYIF
jgi:hypothetical protein